MSHTDPTPTATKVCKPSENEGIRKYTMKRKNENTRSKTKHVPTISSDNIILIITDPSAVACQEKNPRHHPSWNGTQCCPWDCILQTLPSHWFLPVLCVALLPVLKTWFLLSAAMFEFALQDLGAVNCSQFGSGFRNVKTVQHCYSDQLSISQMLFALGGCLWDRRSSFPGLSRPFRTFPDRSGPHRWRNKHLGETVRTYPSWNLLKHVFCLHHLATTKYLFV